MRECVGASKNADLRSFRHGLKADVDQSLAGYARRRNGAVEDVAREWIADDRCRANSVVGRNFRGAYIIRRSGCAGAASRNHKQEDFVVLDELFGGSHGFGGS